MISSHVINVYLVEKYGNETDMILYPKDPVARAQVDHKLYYDTGVLFPAFQKVKVSVIIQKMRLINKI